MKHHVCTKAVRYLKFLARVDTRDNTPKISRYTSLYMIHKGANSIAIHESMHNTGGKGEAVKMWWQIQTYKSFLTKRKTTMQMQCWLCTHHTVLYCHTLHDKIFGLPSRYTIQA